MRWLQRLAWSLDRADSVDLSQLTVMIGGEGVDSSGRLWLSPHQTPEHWRQAILQADVKEMRQRKERLDQTKAKEKSTAKAIGVGMIYTSADLRVQPCFSRFLDVCLPPLTIKC